MIKDVVFKRLWQLNDYKETAELIYSTDPYIYKDLFGSLVNACAVLRYSFDNPESVFYKMAIYIAKCVSRDEVIGTVLFHTNNFVWSVDKMLMDFEKAGVIPGEAFFSASEYMNKTYNYRKIGCSLCNICIKDKYRGLGIATYMLKCLLSTVDNKTIELTVLKDNIAAINLYRKLGFEIVGDAFKDYGGFMLPNVECYKMMLDRH